MDQAEALALWSYEADTGLMRWRIRTKGYGGIKKPGDVAGTINALGYVAIKRKGKLYAVHRLAFLMMTGRWPTEIDHIDGCRSENRWSNLREVTRSQNNLNRKNVRGFSTAKGGKFRAQIKISGHYKHLGTFSTAEQARAAYAAAHAGVV